LTVTDDAGAADSMATTATIGSAALPPAADVGGPYTAVAGATVSFDGSSSVDPDGSITLYDWDFGDDSVGSGVAPSHIYVDSGIYDVSLTVTDNTGSVDSDATSATIGSTAETLQVIFDPNDPTTVIRIENLPIISFSGETIVYDIDFRYETGFDVYGGNLDDFPFTGGTAEPDAVFAMGAINDTLNDNPADPTSVGVPGEDIFYIGIEGEANASSLGFAGGEFDRTEWDKCSTGCLLGIGTVNANDTVTYADLVASDPVANQPPLADAGGPYNAGASVTVSFDGSVSSDPDGRITLYEWDFGDDSLVGRGATPSHAYTTDGIYNVTLTVTDDAGASDSIGVAATIETDPQPPEADAGGPYSGEAGVAVNFDGNRSIDRDCSCFDESGIVFFEWDFDDGNFASGSKSEAEYVSHTYIESGTYNVTLTVTDADGMVDSDSTWANISAVDETTEVILDETNPSTVIRIESLPITLTSGKTIVYDIDFIYERASDVFLLESDYPFRGGTIFREANANLSLAAINNALNANASVPDSAGVPGEDIFYIGFEPLGAATRAVGGEFGVAGWDQCGPPDCVEGSAFPSVNVLATYVVMVVSGPQPPVAVVGEGYSGITAVPVAFDGTGSSDADGTIESYEWDFGDDSPLGSGATPSYTYAAEGTYIVTLTVIDDSGASDSEPTHARIGGSSGSGGLPPSANAGGPYSGNPGVAVSFDGTGSTDPGGSIVSYAWNFGDGLSGSGETVSHEYSEAGVYFVVLAVTDDDNVVDSVGTLALVGLPTQPPTADAGRPPYSGQVGVTVVFDGTDSFDTDGNIVDYEWDFGDDSAVGSGTATASHIYGASGVYVVTLTVTDDNGLMNSDDTLAIVGAGRLPPAADAGGPYYGDPGVGVIFGGRGSVDRGGSIVAYDWTFGDGNIGSGATLSHAYDSNGAYLVILTVTDSSGVPDSSGALVIIAPIADLSVDSIDAAPIPLSVNGQLTYTITVSNSGPSDELEAVADIATSPNAPFVSATATQGTCTVPVSTIECDLGAILNGGTATITVIVIAPPQPSSLPIDVRISGQALDPNSDNNTDSIQINAVVPIATITVSQGGGAFGLIELLLFALAMAALRVRQIRRTSLAVLLSTGVLCGLMLGSPGVSQAQDSAWYMGAGYGSTEADSDTDTFVSDMAALGHVVTNVSIDDSSEGWKVFGGYNINEYFAAELAYVDLGEVTASFDGLSNDPAQMFIDAARLLPVLGDGVSIAALGRYPFGEKFAIFAKVGAYFWQAEASVVAGSVPGGSLPDADGTDAVYGVGGDLYFGSRFGARLEWERYALDPNDVDLVSASLLFRF
jgi:uncharacterized repeat protein (TIGR01451 family)